MEKDGVFKTSVFGGFDKQSVLSYVNEMIEKGQEKERQLTTRCEDAERERDLYLKKYNEESNKTASLQEKIRQLEEANTALEEKEKELQKLREQEESSRAKIAELNGLLAGYEESGRKYNEVASKVGAVMVEAQKQADVIVARAHMQAEQVAQEAISNIYHINKCFDQAMEDVYRLRTFAGQTMQAFDEQMAQLDVFIKESAGRLYIGAGNTGVDVSTQYVQQPSYASASYVQPEENYYAPQPEKASRQEGEFAEAASPVSGAEKTDFFTQPAGV